MPEALANIAWQNAEPTPQRMAVAEALAHPSLVDTTLVRLYGDSCPDMAGLSFRVRHLATGGAKRVYRVHARTPNGQSYPFVLKQFLPIQLAHLPPGATIGGMRQHAAGLDARLLEHIVWVAQRVDERAPGLCPRFGGLWTWSRPSGQVQRVMTEAFVEGHSVDRWKAILDDRFVQGELSFSQYTTQRRALERQAIGAYIRLWDVLGRRTFTSDPSPWNVLLTPTDAGAQPSIIDLHSIHDGGTPLYVFQTLEELFGSRDEIREHALCPAIVDVLGEAEGEHFLQCVRHGLEAQAELRHHTGLTSFAASCQAIERFMATRRGMRANGQRRADLL